MTSTRKKLFFGPLIILFGTVTGLLLAEIILRFATPEWLSKEINELNLARTAEAFGTDAGWSVDKVDGKFMRFTPHSQFRVHYYEYNHLVHIDELGGRIVVESPIKKADWPVVPFLGDSFPFGVGVRDEETFVSLLSKQSHYRYLNLSVPGSALPNQLDQIEFRHKELHSPPVYVFTFYTGNDFMDIFRYYAKLNPAHRDGDRIKDSLFIEWLNHHVYNNRTLGRSYFLQFIQHTVLRSYLYSQAKSPNMLPAPCLIRKGKASVTNTALMLMAATPKCMQEVRTDVKRAVDRLENLSKSLHIHPIFIIIPERTQMSQSLFQSRIAAWGLRSQDMDTMRPNQIVEDELRSHKILFHDLSECLRNRDDVYYPIDGHFTPAGHRVAAQCLGSINAEISSQLRN